MTVKNTKCDNEWNSRVHPFEGVARKIPLEQLFVIMMLNLEGALCSFCFGNILERRGTCRISHNGSWALSLAIPKKAVKMNDIISEAPSMDPSLCRSVWYFSIVWNTANVHVGKWLRCPQVKPPDFLEYRTWIPQTSSSSLGSTSVLTKEGTRPCFYTLHIMDINRNDFWKSVADPEFARDWCTSPSTFDLAFFFAWKSKGRACVQPPLSFVTVTCTTRRKYPGNLCSSEITL